MVNIICFRGKSNTGKTSIIYKILEEYFQFNFFYGFNKRTNSNEKKDITFSFKYEKKKIGINTGGDDKYNLYRIINELKNCDIIICSCRTKGSTELSNFLKKNNFQFDNLKFIEMAKKESFEINNYQTEKIKEFVEIFEDKK
ncbi:MAG: hypothetical protein LAT82_00595 [Nanoarchaeota archaeon]|nr:hypothetical protein [Nanoarchaeota archaeon]